jgi:histone acetyltransferase (RNA polymerase elongator complex component)
MIKVYTNHMVKQKKIEQKKLKNMTSLEKRNFRFTNHLYQTIYDFMKNIHPSIRIERIIRDIPTNEIYGGTTDSGMRSEIDQDMKIVGDRSNDIRSREVFNYQNKEQLYNKTINLKEIVFDSSGGKEYFLSWETNDSNPILFSFLRLRLSDNSGKTTTGKIIFPELVNCALIREVHTYGKVQPCKQNQSYYKNNNILFEDNNNNIQHKGLAKKLLEKAEEIALSNGF